MIALSWLACAYTVTLTSSPMPARVRLPDETTVVTPADVRLRWAPWGHQTVSVSAPGYRTLTADLRRREIGLGRLVATTVWHPSTWFGAPRGEVRLILVPEHGPAGTWTGVPDP